jgi:hypothetical protein
MRLFSGRCLASESRLCLSSLDLIPGWSWSPNRSRLLLSTQQDRTEVDHVVRQR